MNTSLVLLLIQFASIVGAMKFAQQARQVDFVKTIDRGHTVYDIYSKAHSKQINEASKNQRRVKPSVPKNRFVHPHLRNANQISKNRFDFYEKPQHEDAYARIGARENDWFQQLHAGHDLDWMVQSFEHDPLITIE